VGRYVALLRGINVGGKNLIKMADLQACFADHGFDEISTYIQSGNVVFSTGRADQAELEERIERLLTSSFDYDATVVLKSAAQMRRIVADAPDGFGADPPRSRDDVIFLKAPLTARAALRDVPTRDGVDTAVAGTGVLYFSRLTERATHSRLSRVVSMPIYRSITIRNWNTTRKLAELVSAAS
jgi:uncharacterized protein (DUF1697 family)